MNIIPALKLIGVSVAVVTLAACGDSKISAVKDSSFPNAEFTFGETMGKAKGCKNGEWTSELVSDTTFVTYTCTATVNPDIIKMSKDRALRQMAEAMQYRERQYADIVANGASALAQAKTMKERADQKQAADLKVIEEDIENLQKPIPYAPASLMAERERTREQYIELREKLKARMASPDASDLQNIEASQKIVDDIALWKDKYAAAVKQPAPALKKEIDAYYDKDHVVQIKTRFMYRVNAPAKALTAQVLWNGEKHTEAEPVYLLDPARMAEFITYVTKNGRSMEITEKYDAAFPIKIGYPSSGGTWPVKFEFKSQQKAE
jgi:hypothetical protein